MKGNSMRILLMILLAFPLWGAEMKILYTELTGSSLGEYYNEYNRKFRDIWAADSAITFVPEEYVEKLRYKSADKEVPLTKESAKYLRQYGYDSLFAVVPVLIQFDIEPGRRNGFPGAVVGQAEGKMVVRYRFTDLNSGRTLYSGSAESDTSVSLGASIRPLRKSVNISAHTRNMIAEALIRQNIEESYHLLKIYLDDLKRDSTANSSK